ncbi:MAG: hypothetical protein J6S63_05480 [Atopobiaceae bacterium]|nr:hypothetical protein [Atopobiaceae bacterium]
MNATERARISDAYYSGTTTKREVCDAAALLREENENLRAENSKLKQELEAVGTAAYLYGRDGLKAENAKLREQGSRLFDKTLELGTENAKLRELLKEHGIEVA